MFLNWKLEQENGDVAISEIKENVHGRAHADWGIFRLTVCHDAYLHNDGTKLYGIYLSVPSAHSGTWITLKRMRGHLANIITEAENMLFTGEYKTPYDQNSYSNEQIQSVIDDALRAFTNNPEVLQMNITKKDDTSAAVSLDAITESFDCNAARGACFLEWMKQKAETSNSVDLVIKFEEETICLLHVSNEELYVSETGFSLVNELKTTTPLKAVDIQWDYDEEDEDDDDSLDLPNEMMIPAEILLKYKREDEDEEIISDYLSDATGFCHSGFDLKEVTPNA